MPDLHYYLIDVRSSRSLHCSHKNVLHFYWAYCFFGTETTRG